jgi:hypothetical protein
MCCHLSFQICSCHIYIYIYIYMCVCVCVCVCVPLNFSYICVSHFSLLQRGHLISLSAHIYCNFQIHEKAKFSYLYCKRLGTFHPTLNSHFDMGLDISFLFFSMWLSEYCYTWILMFGINLLSPYLLFLTKRIPAQFCVFYILGLLPNLPISDFLSASRITL